MSLVIRWLGVAGIELTAGDQVLAFDPFFSRPTLLQMLCPIRSDPTPIANHLPACNVVLVTHSHYDHVLDIPQVLRHTGATAYGSANTCQLLRLHGVPEDQVAEVQVGDTLTLGAFHVEVINGRHSSIPLGGIFNGNLQSGLRPPLRVQDYHMDVCLGYCITAMGTRLLVCAAEPQPTHILFAGAQETRDYYLRLISGAQPQTFIPIHWDNFTRPLKKPLHRFTRPGGLQLWQITELARMVLPGINVIIPEIFRKYEINGPGT